jgi:hypothetical protein
MMFRLLEDLLLQLLADQLVGVFGSTHQMVKHNAVAVLAHVITLQPPAVQLHAKDRWLEPVRPWAAG